PGSNYGGVEVLKLNNLSVNEGLIASRADFGVHKAVFVGDADQSGGYDSADVSYISGVAVDNAQPFTGVAGRTGLVNYPTLDPRIVADITRDGSVSALDASWLSQKILYDTFLLPALNQPEIPNLPAGTVGQSTVVDPTLDMDDLVLGAAGGSVTV